MEIFFAFADNVHFQNSAILAKELRKTKLEFEFEVTRKYQKQKKLF